MSPAVALLNYISCGILWWIFCQTGTFRGVFSLYIIDMAGCTRTTPYCVFSWVFSIYYLPERSAKLRPCDVRGGGRGTLFHSIGRREIIHSKPRIPQCMPHRRNWSPPTPSSESECVSPLGSKGGATLSCRLVGGGPNSDDRIEGLALSLYTLWPRW